MLDKRQEGASQASFPRKHSCGNWRSCNGRMEGFVNKNVEGLNEVNKSESENEFDMYR